jgi:hypothetical protein
MRITNRSSLRIPLDLWRTMGNVFELDGTLPGAGNDEFGFYRRHKTLCVTILRRRHVPNGVEAVSGVYSFGRITLQPCQNCTPGFATKVFIHELVHAWLHQYRSKAYESWDSCPLSERLALAAFRALGGVSRGDRCGSFLLPAVGQQELIAFKAIVGSVISTPSHRLRKWMPQVLDRRR